MAKSLKERALRLAFLTAAVGVCALLPVQRPTIKEKPTPRDTLNIQANFEPLDVISNDIMTVQDMALLDSANAVTQHAYERIISPIPH